MTTWIYRQKTGALWSPDGEQVGTGYAGYAEGRNNPDLENVANIGPVPRGLYTIGASFKHPKTGPVTMRLAPDSTNTMHGRSAFMIHGDNATHDASEGCIILPRDVRIAVDKSSVKRLQVER
jgi:hypothetical protein